MERLRILVSVFEHFAGVYRLLTHQPYWVGHAAGLARLAGPLPAGARVLDLGCGPGETTRALAALLGPSVSTVGIDLAANMLRLALRQSSTTSRSGVPSGFLRADAAQLPFADARFHVVTGHSFLYLVRDRAAVLREARRVLVPGGRLLLMEPSAHGRLRRAGFSSLALARDALVQPLNVARQLLAMCCWRVFSGQVGRFSPQQLRELVLAAGFTDVVIRETLGGLGLVCTACRAVSPEGGK